MEAESDWAASSSELPVHTSCYRFSRESVQHTVPVQLELHRNGRLPTALRARTSGAEYGSNNKKKMFQKEFDIPAPSPPTDRPDRLSKVVNCVS